MFKTPPITKNLLIINALVFLATLVFTQRGVDVDGMFALHYFQASRFQPHQFITYMFMHGNLTHLLLNMFSLWMFGRAVEEVLGPKRFLTFYLVCGLGAAFCQEIVQYIEYGSLPVYTVHFANVGVQECVNVNGHWIPFNYIYTVGASGCVYGILLGTALLFPEQRIFVFPFPIPIKIKYVVAVYALMEVMFAATSSRDNVAHIAHLGGMLFGWLLFLWWKHKGRQQGGYVRTESFFDRLKAKWQDFRKPRMKVHRGGKFSADMDYNERRRERDAEVDRILEKVKKHGYGVLTEEEKRKLFNAGK